MTKIDWFQSSKSIEDLKEEAECENTLKLLFQILSVVNKCLGLRQYLQI